MEAISDKEARGLASDWVKQIKSSILAQFDDDKPSRGVRATFRPDEKDYGSTKHDFYGDEAEVEARRSARNCPSGNALDYKEPSLEFNANGFVEEHDRAFEDYPFDESNPTCSKTVKEQMIVQTQPACTSRSTPRVDVDFVRQRRLAFFGSDHHSPARGSNVFEFHDYSIRSNGTKPATGQNPFDEVFMYNASSTTCKPYDLDPAENTGLPKQDTFDEMFHLQALKDSLPVCATNSRCNGETRYSPRSALFGEEEEIRLELWGLKDAVKSGEIDLKAYLREPVQKDLATNYAVPEYHQTVVKSPQKSTQRHPKDAVKSGEFDVTTYLRESAQKDHATNSAVPEYHPTSPAVKSPRKSKQRHPKENEGQVHVPCQDFPREGIADADLLKEKSKSKSIPSPNSKKSNSHSYRANGKVTKSNGCAYDGCYSNGMFNTFLHKFDAAEKNENVDCLIHIPKPQINGPLYCGFENSDSESSLLSFGSKCEEVHYRKVLKKRDSSDKLKTKSSPGKKQEKRSKEKILLELTNFIEGSVSPRDEPAVETYNGAVSGKYCVPGNSGFTSKTQEGFISESQVDGKSGMVNGNTKNGYGVDQRDEAGVDLSYNNNELSADDLPLEGCGTAMGKICPKCKEVNSKAANWCIECGTAMISVKPSFLTSHQQTLCEKEYQQTQLLINDTLTRKVVPGLLAGNKVKTQEKQLHDDVSSLSLLVSQSTTNLETAKYSSSPNGYKRRWMRSSTAWSSFNPGELSKSSSYLGENSKVKGKQRSAAVEKENLTRARSASDLPNGFNKERASGSRRKGSWTKGTRQRTYSCNSSVNSGDEVMKPLERGKGHNRPHSAKQSPRRSHGSQENITPGFGKRPSSAQTPSQQTQDLPAFTEDNSRGNQLKSSILSCSAEEFRPSTSQVMKPVVPPLNLQDVDNYDRILTLIRTQRDSDPVPYLYLPDEILLQIFSCLCHKDLVACSRVCGQFYRVSMDESLWKVIVMKKSKNITDEWLFAIGKHRPVSLTISQCHGDKVTSKGLREMFRSCSDTLEELNFSGCRGGELIGESILLHVSARCRQLRSVDASWSNVGDNGVQALVDNVERLECLCLNGCPAITDESIKCLANKHGTTLRIFEVFGCFNITPAGIRILGQTCTQLQTLNIGQCHKITDSAIGVLVSNLSELENLDLRGCKQARDSAVKKIVRFCPLVTNLVLANCPYITDVSLAEIATNIPRIRSLDICGCAKVSDNGIRALSKACQRLELLDLTSTGVSHRSVLSLANYCSQSLCNLKLSFCSDISDNTVAHLARHCKRLTTLHLYGCKRIRNTSALRSLNPALTIEC